MPLRSVRNAIGLLQRLRAALRDPRRGGTIARALWIVWAFLLWNVVFDYVIVVAGRRYIAAAETAGVPRANVDAYMRPAVTRAVWIASAAAAGVLATGLAAVGAARRRVTS